MPVDGELAKRLAKRRQWEQDTQDGAESSLDMRRGRDECMVASRDAVSPPKDPGNGKGVEGNAEDLAKCLAKRRQWEQGVQDGAEPNLDGGVAEGGQKGRKLGVKDSTMAGSVGDGHEALRSERGKDEDHVLSMSREEAGAVAASKLEEQQQIGFQTALAKVGSGASLDMMKILVRNICQNPSEEKYRKIRLTNEKIAAALVVVDSAKEAMLAMGWLEEGEFLVLPAKKQLTFNKEVRYIEDAKTKLEKEQEKSILMGVCKKLDETEKKKLCEQMGADRKERSGLLPVVGRQESDMNAAQNEYVAVSEIVKVSADIGFLSMKDYEASTNVTPAPSSPEQDEITSFHCVSSHSVQTPLRPASFFEKDVVFSPLCGDYPPPTRLSLHRMPSHERVDFPAIAANPVVQGKGVEGSAEDLEKIQAHQLKEALDKQVPGAEHESEIMTEREKQLLKQIEELQASVAGLVHFRELSDKLQRKLSKAQRRNKELAASLELAKAELGDAVWDASQRRRQQAVLAQLMEREQAKAQQLNKEADQRAVELTQRLHDAEQLRLKMEREFWEKEARAEQERREKEAEQGRREKEAEQERLARSRKCVICLTFFDTMTEQMAICQESGNNEEEGHATCKTCFEEYADTEISKGVVELQGQLRCPLWPSHACGCKGIFTDQTAAMMLSGNLHEKYKAGERQKIRREEYTKSHELVIRMANELRQKMPGIAKEVLARQMREANPNARQCVKCGFGPLVHFACADLRAHQGQRVAGDGMIDNSCPRCGFLASSIHELPPWNGEVPEEALPLPEPVDLFARAHEQGQSSRTIRKAVGEGVHEFRERGQRSRTLHLVQETSALVARRLHTEELERLAQIDSDAAYARRLSGQL